MISSARNSPNKLEKRAIQLFTNNELPLKFVGDFNNPKYFIEKKVPDFVATNSKKILVEVYADYYKVRDYGSVENYKKERSEIFSRHGWKTLFFNEKELKETPNACVNLLKMELLK